jgi:hypothetical protein
MFQAIAVLGSFDPPSIEVFRGVFHSPPIGRRQNQKPARKKGRKTMRNLRAIAITKLFLAALAMTLVFAGRAQAQGADTVYRGTFTLTQQIHWGRSVLRPGHYTMTMASIGSPAIVKIQNEDTGEGFRVVTAVREETTAGTSALFLQAKNGRASVYSLSLPQLGIVLIYEPTLAREPVLEARAGMTVPVLLAKK